MSKKEKVKLIAVLSYSDMFKVLKDGWIKDKSTGLDWGLSSDKYLTLKQAEEYCKKLKGRLPTIHELHSLVDYTKESPAIDGEIFKDNKSSYYWSSTRTCWNKNASWCVGFKYGRVDDSIGAAYNYVRPVRDSQ